MTVEDPITSQSVYEIWLNSEQNSGKIWKRKDVSVPTIHNLGAGTDYTPFFQHTGIPSADLRFSSNYGVYHSIYDSYSWIEKYGDPDFKYCVTLAQIWGIIILRLADSILLPFNYRDYANLLLDEYYILKSKYPNSTLDYSSLEEAILHFTKATADLSFELQNSPRDGINIRNLNDKLMNIERQFILTDGLPGRNWFGHVIFAPGLYDGYGSQVYPSIFQALQDNTLNIAQLEINSVARLIENAAFFTQS